MVLSSEQCEAEGLPCPRCDSRETKFCYFNNYSTTQPRHFCRNCKRYWTAGGTLRNVPMGGGLRKNKKSKLSRHGKDLLSASTDGSPSSGNCNALVHASPSSSADGVVDESHEKPVVPLLPYHPSFESDAVAGDCHPFTSPSFEYMNARSFAHCNDALLARGIEQHAQDANQGWHRPHFGFGCGDQAQSSSGEISSEPSQARHSAAVPLAMYPSNSTLHRYNGIEQQSNGAPNRFQDNFNELAYASKLGNLQCAAGNFTLSHSANPRKRSATDDEDEGLGNVINVRHPYDWEQVSEVVFRGTPDFFQMPTF